MKEETTVLQLSRGAVVAALLIAAGCRAAVVERRSVEIPGDTPANEKMLIARRVIDEMRTPIRELTGSSIPNAPADQLDLLELVPTRVVAQQVTEAGATAIDTVYIECRIPSAWGDAITQRIVEVCADALTRRLDALR